MTNLRIFRWLTAATVMLSVAPRMTADDGAPDIFVNNFDERVLYRAISDNGRWAVVETRPDYDGGKVVDLSDMSYVTVTNLNDAGQYGHPLDVTDDGEIVVGTYGIEFYEQPAVWRRSTGQWEILDYDSQRFGGGHVAAVTPDGHWAVGRVMGRVNIFSEATALWDLTTGKMVETPNLPAPQLDTFNQNQNRFTAISPDGRYICAQLSPGGSVVYDREEQRYYRPQGTLPDGSTFRLSVAGMSPGCRYLFGPASINGAPAYNEDDDSWSNYCIYDMADGSAVRVRDAALEGNMIWGVSDDAVLYAGSGGNGTPMRDFQIYANGYWYALDQILYQAYGIDYYVYTRLSNTGTPYALSADGRTFASFTDPNRGEGWVMKFKESLHDACSRVDLMGAYEMEPRNGSVMSRLTSIRIGYDRNILVGSNPGSVTLTDENGALIAKALTLTAFNNIATITFRSRDLEPGKVYHINIPAGTIMMEGASEVANRAMTVEYTGRPAVPVAVADGFIDQDHTLRCIDYSANFITIPMDAQLKLAEGAHAAILRDEDGEKMSDLLMSVSGNSLILRASATIPLFRYSDYRIVVDAGSVTDPGGSSVTANEEFTVIVHGNWEEQPGDDTTIFTENFNNGLGAKFMFYEGDHLQPSSAMQEWGFEADTTPWWVVRDSYYTDDYAACSHSMYSPRGRSNDWMVVRRLYIPDEKCRLQFDSQSYRPDYEDRLSVYVIPCDILYNAVTAECMQRFLDNRILVYDELQEPGESSETMEGEWRHNDLSLADYAGKYVYIAFVNENEGGSAIFVDNVKVVHDMSVSMTMLSPAVVTALDEQVVSVKLYLNSEGLRAEKARISLVDEDGYTVGVWSMTPGMAWTFDEPLEVTFDNPLPLAVGGETRFSIGVEAGEISTRFDRSILSLAFATTKHAVLEEYSGASCGNCPDGILVTELLSRDFGDRFIPLSIRSYMGDELTPLNSNYSSLLGLEALGAPSGAVNRRYGGYPVGRNDDGSATPYAGNAEEGLWYDFVAAELALPACADIEMVCTPDADAGRIDIDATAVFAVARSNAEYSLFAVLTEDRVSTRQSNYRYQSTDPFYGEWGQGGIYGKAYIYPYMCDDVVRNVSNPNLVGTIGWLPAEIEANDRLSEHLSIAVPARDINIDNCRVTVMLIDNATGFVENAVSTTADGATQSLASTAGNGISIRVEGDMVAVVSALEADVTVCDLAGAVIAAGHGRELLLPKGNGIAVVKCATPSGVRIAKVF